MPVYRIEPNPEDVAPDKMAYCLDHLVENGYMITIFKDYLITDRVLNSKHEEITFISRELGLPIRFRKVHLKSFYKVL